MASNFKGYKKTLIRFLDLVEKYKDEIPDDYEIMSEGDNERLNAAMSYLSSTHRGLGSPSRRRNQEANKRAHVIVILLSAIAKLEAGKRNGWKK